MRSSSIDTRRVVNARDTSLRSIVCFGGSSQMIIPVLTGSGDMVSSVVPWFELNVAASRLCRLDVVEPREREEVEPIVVVRGRFVSHPLPQRVRIVTQLWSDRVPVDGRHQRLRERVFT